MVWSESGGSGGSSSEVKLILDVASKIKKGEGMSEKDYELTQSSPLYYIDQHFCDMDVNGR
jgi:hypothetical protein